MHARLLSSFTGTRLAIRSSMAQKQQAANSFALLSVDDSEPAAASASASSKKKKKAKAKSASTAQGFGEPPPAQPEPKAKETKEPEKQPEKQSQPAQQKPPAAGKSKAAKGASASKEAQEKAQAAKEQEAEQAAAEGDGEWKAAGKKSDKAAASQDFPLKKPLLWIDCEMTGLDLEKDVIMEIACIATDGSLQHQEEGPCIAVRTSKEALEGMNDWCKEHHGPSGLTKRCRESEHSMADAEEQVLAFVRRFAAAGEATLAGNSVHCDLAFLKKDMPRLAKHLHYRILDVSSLKVIAERWFPKQFKDQPRKKNAHRALDDIRESIEELKWYKGAIFKGGDGKAK